MESVDKEECEIFGRRCAVYENGIIKPIAESNGKIVWVMRCMVCLNTKTARYDEDHLRLCRVECCSRVWKFRRAIKLF